MMMEKLFADNLNRLEILSCAAVGTNKIKIHVHRNHSFEMIASVMNQFLNFSDIKAEFEYSSYDDSLTFPDKLDADLHVIWLDLDRYNKDYVQIFLQNKVQELRNKTTSAIILACLGQSIETLSLDISDIYVLDVYDKIKKLNDKAFDLAKQDASGTRLSNKASLFVSQYLGLKLIPSLFQSALKAIVLDLDNTLYYGVIGEDGIDNVVPYLSLQKKLKKFKEQGFLLCISSKNDEADVRQLFDKRKDFVLSWSDFTITKINWNSKADNIRNIARELNIGTDSILFIDDNIAEIETVTSLIPDIKTINASDEETMLRMLNLYPWLIKTSVSKEDAIRSNDLRANKERSELAHSLSKEEYFKRLEMKLELKLNDEENINRIAELLNKTNQFILSYKRYNITQVLDLLKSNDACIVTAKMSDKLSDSGIIAILIAIKDNDILVVDELTFSCRALGRNIEDIVICKMLSMAESKLKTSNVARINYTTGPRNMPALTWLSNFSNLKLEQEGSVQYLLSDNVEVFGLDIKEVA